MQGSQTKGEVITGLLTNYPKYHRFITSHISRLIDQGPAALGSAYRTKMKTVQEHKSRLAQYKISVTTSYQMNAVQSFEREIERLQVELDVLKDALQGLGLLPRRLP
jgi:hypothetical protein